MADRALQLKWHVSALSASSAWRMARAYVGSAESQFEIQASGPGADGLFRWNAYWGPVGTAPSLFEAQLAAEAAAFAWLRECLATFGARVLTREQVPVAFDSLVIAMAHHLRLSSADGDERERKSDAARAIARELETPRLLHVLIGGLAACGAGLPSEWPHARWVRESEKDDATCELCRAAVERLRVERTCSGRERR